MNSSKYCSVSVTIQYILGQSKRGDSLVWSGFYGISTIVGYLMPNVFYTYILNI